MSSLNDPFAQFSEQPKKEETPTALSIQSETIQKSAAPTPTIDPFAQFEPKAEPKKEGRYGKVIGSAALSGALDLPAGIEDFLIRKPAKYALKGAEALGAPISEEQSKMLTETALPTTEILYKNGYLASPETTGERYASAATKGAVGGGILGSRAGPYGALIGGVVGALTSVGIEGAKDLGISDGWIDAALYTLGVSGLAANKFAGPTKAATAESIGRISSKAGEGNAVPPRETIQEKSLQHLQQPKIETTANKQITVSPEPIPNQNRSLAGRVSTEVGQFQTRPIPSANQVLSPEEFTSSAEGGNSLNRLVMDRFNQRSDISRGNFEQAAADAAPYEFNFEDTDTLRELVDRTRTELQQSGSPSRSERAVINRLNEVEQLIGAPGTLQGGPAQRLISTSNSIGQSLNHDLDYVGVENLLRPIMHELNVAGRSAVQRGGGNIERINHADQYYSNLADTFQNKDIRPYLNELVSDPESLYKKAVENPGTYRSLQTALSETPEGQRAMRIVTNELVKDKFADYVKNPSRIGDENYLKLMKETTSLIGEEQAHNVQTFLQNKKIASQRLKSVEPRTREVHASAKYLELPIEKFEAKLKTISGIREISKDMQKTENGRKLAKDLWREETEKMLRDGQAHPKSIRADRAAEILNEERNFKILSEFIGEEAAKQELENLQALGKKEIRRDNLANAVKKGALFKVFHTLFF